MKIALQVGCGAFMFAGIVAAKAARLGITTAAHRLTKRAAHA